jgi:hypothetical protein
MFQRLHTLQESYDYRLGAAPEMEHTVPAILDSSIKAAQDEQVPRMFGEHRIESGEHIGRADVESAEHIGAQGGHWPDGLGEQPLPVSPLVKKVKVAVGG